MLARFANLLHQYTGRAEYRQMAEAGMRYLAAPAIAKRFPAATALIAEWELSHEPIHLTIVGPKNDAAGRALFQVAGQFPSAYKRVEWWDRREGDLPRKDVTYPEFKKPALFVCTATSCSVPSYQPDTAQARIRRLLGTGG